MTNQPTEPRTCPGRNCDSALRNEFLCRRCVRKVEYAIADLPALASELDKTIARQSTGSDGAHVNAGGASRLPLNLAAMEKRNHAQLVTVAAFELGYRPDPANLVGTVYAVLADTSPIQYRQDGPEFAKIVHRAVAEWRAVIDRHEDRVFAGRCDECNTEMYTRPNVDVTRCPGCEKEFDTAGQLRWVLDQIRETLWPIDTVRTFAQKQLDFRINTATVRSWRHRGQLVARGLDIHGRELYRVGDYLDLATALERRQRTDRESA